MASAATGRPPWPRRLPGARRSTSASPRRAGRPQDIDVVAVDVGPGLFGGIRAGLATAQAVAGAVGVPMVPVLLARRGRAPGGDRPPADLVGGRRPPQGEVAVGPYRPVPGGVVRDGGGGTGPRQRLPGPSRGRSQPKCWSWATGRRCPRATLHRAPRRATGRPAVPLGRRPSAEIARGRARARRPSRTPTRSAPDTCASPTSRINWSDFRRRARGPDDHRSGRMTTADVAAVAELERAVFDDPWSAAAFLEELAASRAPLLGGRGEPPRRRLRRGDARGGGRPHHHAGGRPPVANRRGRHPAHAGPGRRGPGRRVVAT